MAKLLIIKSALLVAFICGYAYHINTVSAKGITRTDTGLKYWYVVNGDTTNCTSFNEVADWSNKHL